MGKSTGNKAGGGRTSPSMPFDTNYLIRKKNRPMYFHNIHCYFILMLDPIISRQLLYLLICDAPSSLVYKYLCVTKTCCLPFQSNV